MGLSKYVKISKKNKVTIALTIPFIILIVTSGIRDITVGQDTWQYVRMYLRLNLSNLFENNYYIYDIYAFIVKQLFHSSYVALNLITACIINGCTYFWIKKYSCDYTLSIAIYLGMGIFFNTMNQFRAYLALAVLLWAFDAAIQKNKKLFFCLILLAIFIHNTSIVLAGVLTIVLYIDKIKYRYYVLFSIACILFYFNYHRIIKLFIKIFPQYNMYMQSWVELDSGNWNSQRILILIIEVIIEIFAIYMYIYKRKKERMEQAFIIINLFGILINILVVKLYLFIRIAMMFEIFFVIYVPYYLNKYFKKKYMINSLIYLCLILYMYICLKNDGSNIASYKTFFGQN